jgi:hypothetical protein
MKRTSLLSFIGAFGLAGAAMAQTPSTSAPAAAPSTTTSPDAVYAKPSGQDSQPNKAPPLKKQRAVATQKKAPSASTGTGTVESRGAKAADQSAAVRKVAKQKSYSGNSGKKPDPGTACSTARPTPNGGLDCGMSGDSATPRALHTH